MHTCSCQTDRMTACTRLRLQPEISLDARLSCTARCRPGCRVSNRSKARRRPSCKVSQLVSPLQNRCSSDDGAWLPFIRLHDRLDNACSGVVTPDGTHAQDVQEAIVVLDEGEDHVLLRDPAARRCPSVGATQTLKALNLHHTTAAVGVLHQCIARPIATSHRVRTVHSLQHAVLISLSPGAEPSLQAHPCKITRNILSFLLYTVEVQLKITLLSGGLLSAGW